MEDLGLPFKSSCIKNEDYDDVVVARVRLEGALQSQVDPRDTSNSSFFNDVTNDFLAYKKPPRKRRRKKPNDDLTTQTCIVSLFDRSVDLGQFSSESPLYPVCRSWLYNNQLDGLSKAKPLSPEFVKTEKDSDDDSPTPNDIHEMPIPLPASKNYGFASFGP